MTRFDPAQPIDQRAHRTDAIVHLHAPIARRRAIGWLGGAGTTILLTACGSDSGSTPTMIPTPTPTPLPAPSPSPTATPLPVPGSASVGCAVTLPETTAPYPADGTGATSGSVNNVLNQPGIVRSDIRTSFIGSTSAAAGVRLTLSLSLLNAGGSCGPLAGYAVYVWHADAGGRFSLYTIPGETYLRGVQQADGNGKVSFTTIVPGCFAGRYPHIHVAIFPTLAGATVGTNAVFATQLILPPDMLAAVYADTSIYAGAQANLAAVPITSDPVFGGDSAAQNMNSTLVATGNVAAGYAAELTISPALGGAS